MICPNCGKETEEGLFCDNCGAQLDLEVPDPAVPEEAAEPIEAPADPNEGKWKKTIPVFFIAGAAINILISILFLIGAIINAVRGGGFKYETIPALPTLFMFATAVLFFLKTKKKPFLTAIPYVLYAFVSVIAFIVSLVSLIALTVSMSGYFSSLGAMWIVNLIVSFIIAIASLLTVLLAASFMVGMLVKKKTKLFMTLYIIVAVVATLVSVLSLIWSIVFAATGAGVPALPAIHFIAAVLNIVCWICVHIGVIFALRDKAAEENKPAEEPVYEEAPAEAE